MKRKLIVFFSLFLAGLLFLLPADRCAAGPDSGDWTQLRRMVKVSTNQHVVVNYSKHTVNGTNWNTLYSQLVSAGYALESTSTFQAYAFNNSDISDVTLMPLKLLYNSSTGDYMDTWIYSEQIQSGWTYKGTIAYVMTPNNYSSAPMGSKKYKRGYYDGGGNPSRADHMRNDWSESSFCCGYTEDSSAYAYMYESSIDFPTPDLDVTYTGNVPSTVPHSGGSYTVRVENDGDGTLSWYKHINVSWISVNKSSGTVNSVTDYDSVTITVESNTSTSFRSGNVTFYNQYDTSDYESVYIYQEGKPPVPDLDVANTGNIPNPVPYAGGSYTVRVENDRDGTLSWYNHVNVSWIGTSSTSGSVNSGTDYDSVTITVGSNTGTSSRSGNVTFYNQYDTSDYENLYIYQEVQPKGQVSVTITPAEACDAGGRWNLDGGSWQTSGTTLSNIDVGNHQISFNEISGWSSPEPISIEVASGQATSKTATYTQQTGAISVNIEPVEAIGAGAKWKVAGKDWKESGDAENGLPLGEYTVEFFEVSGWTKPMDITSVVVRADQTESLMGTYTKNTGSLKVDIGPTEARDAGGQWRINGGQWLNSGDEIPEIEVGKYTIEFSDLEGWNKPDSITDVEILPGEQTVQYGTYIMQTGALTVSITPQSAADGGAQWSLDRVVWKNGGETISDLEPGMYTIYFGELEGFVAPETKNDVYVEPETIVQETGEYKNASYSLSNSYIYLHGENGYISELKFDADGTNDYGANIIHENGTLDWQIGGSFFSESGGFISAQEDQRLELSNGNGDVWEIVLDGNLFKSTLTASAAVGELQVRLDLPYENEGYYDYARKTIWEDNFNNHDASDIPFRSFYASTGNTRTIEYFMRRGHELDHYLQFRTNRIDDIDDYIQDSKISSQPDGLNRLLAIGTGDFDIDFYHMPSHNIWVEKNDVGMTLVSGQETSDAAARFEFEVTRLDTSKDIDVNELGDKMPYFYTSANETIVNRHAGEYSFDELLNRFYRQGAFHYTNVGLHPAWNWVAQYTCFVNSWYRNRLKRNQETWEQGDAEDGPDLDGYMHSWPGSPQWPLGGYHLNTNAMFIQAVWHYYAWTGDDAFLQGQMERVRKAMNYQLDRLGGNTDFLIDGSEVFNGAQAGRNGDACSNWWDLLPFGGKDAYASIDFYNSLQAMKHLEEAAGNAAGADSYRLLAESVRESYNEAFWNGDGGKYIGAIDADGVKRDFGFTFVNLQALAAGLGDPVQAGMVFDWLDSSGAYDRWQFAPRSNTEPVSGWWSNGSYPWDDQVQNGGAALYVAGYDVIARAKMADAEDAYQRLKSVLQRYSEPDKLTGGGTTIYGDVIQGAGQAGAVGVMSNEFVESGFAGASFLYAFIGLRPEADGLHIEPKLPPGQEYIGADNIDYRGMTLHFRITQDTIAIDCTKNDGGLENHYIVNGERKAFPEGIFSISESYVEGAPPTAVISGVSPSPANPLTDTVQFRENSHDNDENGESIVAWKWSSDLGNWEGNSVLSSEQNPDISADDLQVGLSQHRFGSHRRRGDPRCGNWIFKYIQCEPRDRFRQRFA